MANTGVYGARRWFQFTGQTGSGVANALFPIGVSGEDDTISVHAIPTFTDNVVFNVGAGEAVTFTGYGRLTTGSVAGSACTLDASYTYGEAIELRYTVSSWTGIGSAFKAMYLRSEATLGGSVGVRCAEFYGVMNTSTTTGLSNLQVLYTEMLIKASASNRTLTGGNSIEANISVENQTGTLTLTNNVYCIHAKAQTGTGIAAYTKINGIKISGRDDGTARVFGIGLDISDPEATVCTWTKGISISTSCAKAISISGTQAIGIDLAGTFTGHGIYINNSTFASGKRALRIGDYGTEIEVAGGEGLIRSYAKTTSGTGATALQFHWGYVTSTANLIGSQSQYEVQTTVTGPTSIMGNDIIVGVSATGLLADSATVGEGLIGQRVKIYGSGGTVTGHAVTLWLDNQINVVTPGRTEASILGTTGGSKPDTFIWLNTTSSGWSQFLYLDSTMAAAEPFVASGCDVAGAGASEPYLKVLINATQYGIPLIAI